MSTAGLIIEERSRDIGDFLVGRVLPFRKKRMVGPFIFIDHMGPMEIGPGNYMDVGQHPHIGLSTLTYLFEGNIMHRDSLGTEQLIDPGSAALMTAGKGIVHTERTPIEMRDGNNYPVHGLQLWIALPLDKEQMEPEFFFSPKGEVPSWSDEHFDFRLVAGEAFGRKSSLPVYSSLFMVELKARSAGLLSLAKEVSGEIGIYVLDGHVKTTAETIGLKQMLVSKHQDHCEIGLSEDAHVFLLGGEPFEEGRQIHWNFVASSKELINQAADRWKAQQYEMVPGEKGFIPLP
jgi:redox-sensitive bicupin YhaK (pirin superfamily)